MAAPAVAKPVVKSKRQLPIPLPGLSSLTGGLSPAAAPEEAEEVLPEEVFFPVKDQAEICDAFTELTDVHQTMLENIMSKRKFVNFDTITVQTAKILRLLEREFDDFAAVLIEFVPTCATSVTEDRQSLEETMKESIETFAL